MPTRRDFLQQSAAYVSTLALGAAITPQQVQAAAQHLAYLSPAQAALDEDFWTYIQQAYTVSPNLINLNNGGVAPQPRIVQEQFEHYNRLSNEAPSYYMWRILDQGREPLRQKLGTLAGCSAEELAIVRNATEALNIVQQGIPLEVGDEVVLCTLDYPNMMNAWKLRERREKIKLVWVDLKLPSEDDDALVNAYVSRFTPRTRIVHLTHLINWTGQILPVRKIADEARKRGILVICDGAHSFAHLEYKIPDLGCDYYGTSLHKWLSAPFGTGLLYVRQDRIAGLWPLMANDKPDSDNIRKFEVQGTRSFATEMAIGTAIDFFQGIGAARKQARLHYLQRRWTDAVRNVPRVTVHTSPLPQYGGALALVSIAGMKPAELEQALFSRHKIHTVAIDYPGAVGVRVTPNVYTRPSQVDLLAQAITELAAVSSQNSKQ